MATKAELEEQIVELRASQATAEALNQVSRDLNVAADEHDMLQAVLGPMGEFGVGSVSLMYVDLDQVGEPEWIEYVADWHSAGLSTIPIGTRFYVP